MSLVLNALCSCYFSLTVLSFTIYATIYLCTHIYNLYMAIYAWNANNKKALNYCAEMKSTNLWCLHASFSTQIYIHIFVWYARINQRVIHSKHTSDQYNRIRDISPFGSETSLDGSNCFMSGNSDVLQIHKFLVYATKMGALCYPDLIYLPLHDCVYSQWHHQ